MLRTSNQAYTVITVLNLTSVLRASHSAYVEEESSKSVPCLAISDRELLA